MKRGVNVGRRAFVKTGALFALIAACNPGALFAPRSLHLPRGFFGHMVPGSLLLTPEAVTIPVGTYRDWNNGASLEWVYQNNWEGFDAAIATAASLGAGLLHVLAGESTTPLPYSISYWRTCVQDIVDRAAGRIPYWEIWNEPVYNRAPAAQMREYAAEAYAIIKAAQPAAIVLTPSLNELLTEYGYRYAAEYLSGEQLADAVAYHSYDPLDQVGRVVARLRDLTDLPLWNTETVGVASLELLARAGVERVVLNSQIPGNEDWDALTALGTAYNAEYARLAA